MVVLVAITCLKKSNFIDICLLDVRQIDTSSEYVHIFLFFKHIQVLHVLVLVENKYPSA